jgi:hypothetical protein
MRTGTARVYLYSADQIADAIITPAKLAADLVNGKVRAYRATSVQAIGAGAWTKVQLNAETFDVPSAYDPTTNYRFTVPAGYAGYYLIHSKISVLTFAAAGYAEIAIYKNGVIAARGGIYIPAGITSGHVAVTDYLALAAADYIEIYVNFSQTGDVSFGEYITYLDIARIF